MSSSAPAPAAADERAERCSTRAASATSSRPRRCLARCRCTIRRSAAPMGCMRSSSRARPSPRRAQANRRTWLYRIRPAAEHGPFAAQPHALLTARIRRRRRHRTRCAGIRCRCPRRATDFLDGLVTMGGNGAPQTHSWLRHSPVRRQPLDATASVLRRRWRTADRAAARYAAAHHRTRPYRARAAGDRSHSARRALSHRAAGRHARGYVCENFGAPLAPARPRPDRLQRPGLRAGFPHAGGLRTRIATSPTS